MVLHEGAIWAVYYYLDVYDTTSFAYIQCDQIRRNFATLAKVYKSLVNFQQFISYLAKYLAYFGKFVTLLS